MNNYNERVEELKKRFKPLKSKFDKKRGQLSAYNSEINELQDREDKLDDELIDYNDMAEIFRQLSVDLKSNLKELVEGLTTKALQSIWQEKDIEFKLEFEEKRNQIETNFLIQEGEYISEDILNEHGGGVADVVSFMIRVVIHQFYEPSLPNVFIMDEPFKHVSGSDYLELLAEFIHELSRELDFQFYLTSHQQDLLRHSDKTFEVTLREGEEIDTSDTSVIKEPENEYKQYIHSVELRNFQSHKNTKIDLNGHVNYISGKSNTGKSGLYRGIIWCLRNQPTGDFFIRHCETDAEVSITLEDQREDKDKLTTITRYRSASKNEYLIDDVDEPITGFRNDVPDLVEEITGFREAKFSNDLSYPLNKYSQHESYFLLQETPGNVTDVIGSTTGVHIVDHAVKITNNKKRELEKERKSIKDSINDKEEKINELSYVEKLSKYVEGLDNSIDNTIERLEKLEKLKNLKSEYKTLTTEIESIDEKLLDFDFDLDVENLNDKFEKLKDLTRYSKQTEKLNNSIDKLQETLNSFPNELETYDTDIIRQKVDRWDSLQLLNNSINANKDEIERLDNHLNKLPAFEYSLDRNKIDKLTRLKELESSTVELKSNIDDNQERIKECLSQIKEVESEFEKTADGEICPICEQQIDSRKVLN